MSLPYNPTVYIVDDDPAVRDSIEQLMTSINIQTKGYDTPSSFLNDYEMSFRGCIVLDIRMPEISGIGLQERLLERHHCLIPIIFLTAHGDIPTAIKAIKNGAIHFVQKPFGDQSIIDVVNEALKQDSRQYPLLLVRQKTLECLSSLTAREHEVLHHVVAGKVNKVIAMDINLSQRTVEIHRSRVMNKMQTKSLAQLVRQIMDVKDHLPEGFLL